MHSALVLFGGGGEKKHELYSSHLPHKNIHICECDLSNGENFESYKYIWLCIHELDK